MANNRMYLVNKRTKAKIFIAKYYPSTGWYCPEGIEERLNSGFDESDFGHLSKAEREIKSNQVGFGAPYSLGGMIGDEWEIMYEITSELKKTRNLDITTAHVEFRNDVELGSWNDKK